MRNTGGILKVTMICFASLWILLATANPEDFTKPVLIERPDPVLTASLRKSAATGTVMMKVQVDKNGSVTGVEFIRSSSAQMIDKFFIEWVEKWRYLPRTDGASVETGFTIVTIRFNLKEGSIDAPSPIRQAVQLPDSIVAMTQKDHSDSTSNPIPDPIEPLRIKFIPISIQGMTIQEIITFKMSIDDAGLVLEVSSEPQLDNSEFNRWITEYLKSTKWKVDSGISNLCISIVLDCNTTLCKFDFNQPSLCPVIP